MNGYIAFVEGVKHEIYAETSFAASLQAKALYTGRKKYPRIEVILCELEGEQVSHYITD